MEGAARPRSIPTPFRGHQPLATKTPNAEFHVRKHGCWPINRATPRPSRPYRRIRRKGGDPVFGARAMKKNAKKPAKSKTIHDKLNAAYEQMKKTHGPCR